MFMTRDVAASIRRAIYNRYGQRYLVEIGERLARARESNRYACNALLWAEDADLIGTVRLERHPIIAGDNASEGFVILDCYLYGYGANGSLVDNVWVALSALGKVLTLGGSYEHLAREVKTIAARQKLERDTRQLDMHCARVACEVAGMKIDETPLGIVADWVEEYAQDTVSPVSDLPLWHDLRDAIARGFEV